MNILKYPDGSSYADIKDQNIEKFTFRVPTYEELWHLGQILEVANFRGIKPTVIIPNLIDSQADRRFSTTQSSGLKMVCNFLNSFDVSKYRVFHPHNPEALEASLNNVEIIDNSEFIIKVLYELDGGDCGLNTNVTDNLILMSSDAGGFKPLMKLCDHIKWKGETFSASKSRSWDEEIGTKFVQQIDRADFQGKDLLIVDDLSVYGGTFKGLSKLLKERNCGKLYLAVSHITVQNLGDDPVTNYFDRVFTTNSKFGDDPYYTNFKYKDSTGPFPKNLKVLKLF